MSVDTDGPAKVVIDEIAGVIVMGENVRISTVAIAQGNLTINPTLMPKLPYSVFGDFVPVASMGRAANVIAVNPNVPVKTIKELVELRDTFREILGRPVDLITYGGLKAVIDDDIRSEAVLL